MDQEPPEPGSVALKLNPANPCVRDIALRRLKRGDAGLARFTKPFAVEDLAGKLHGALDA